MIGVIAKHSELRAVTEFFELFKTPWENYVPGHSYEIVLTTAGRVPQDPHIRVLAIYDSRRIAIDAEIGIATLPRNRGGWLQFGDIAFPLYGEAAEIQGMGQSFLQYNGDSTVAGCEFYSASYRIVRVGYDLFQEIEILLSKGQPALNAHIPTLEIHISLLRRIMVQAGLQFVEVMPAPAGYDFMACLTHDVDFTGIREHKGDSTMWGFLYRATAGSLWNALRGKLSWSKCWTNWQAALSLPLVHAGLKDDFWLEFERYSEIEKNLGSTFFFLPYRNRPGIGLGQGSAPQRRAAKYDIVTVKEGIRELTRNGCEIGLHGIDAWHDSDKGKDEQSRICEITGDAEIGVRMHWLYFDEDSPGALEKAGFCYDSTCGYNDTVGFRAGTGQVFCIPPAELLLELPLVIQDTALFYPGRMHLSEAQAMGRCQNLIRQAANYGGVVTVNWHTRSLSPERLWGEFYQKLLAEMQQFRVWFAPAGQIVDWFRARRTIQFESVDFGEDGLRLKLAGPTLNDRSSFIVRVYQPNLNPPEGSILSPATSVVYDILWKGEAELTCVRETPARA